MGSNLSSFKQTIDKKNLTVGAVVLAGGLARRMGGQDKGLVELHGKPMASWAIHAIQPLVHRLVINANRNEAEYLKLGAPVVADAMQGHLGPLAGLSAGIAALDTDFVFMCPCDSPFINPDLINRLGAELMENKADIAVAHDGERLQPVFALVSTNVAGSLDEFLLSGERKIDKWYAQQNMIAVESSEFAHSFRNINTEEERLQAETELMER